MRHVDCEMVDVEVGSKNLVVSSEVTGLRLAEVVVEQPP